MVCSLFSNIVSWRCLLYKYYIRPSSLQRQTVQAEQCSAEHIAHNGRIYGHLSSVDLARLRQSLARLRSLSTQNYRNTLSSDLAYVSFWKKAVFGNEYSSDPRTSITMVSMLF